MSNWRVLAGAAAFAAVISLLAGLIRGNPFGIVVIRMLISAAAGGGLALAALQLLRRFLPELVREAAAPAPPAASRLPEVDILIPEENPHQEAGQAVGAAGGIPAGGAGGSMEPEELAPADEQEGRAADEGKPAAETGGGPGETAGMAEAAFVEQLEAASRPPAARPAGAGEEREEVESLPDIDLLGADPGPARVSPAGRRLNGGQNRRALHDQKPQDLAKAVRTFLKKDQEG